MRLRRFSTLLGGVLAIGAITAGSSAAAVFTQAAAWNIADPFVEKLPKPTTIDTEVVEHTAGEPPLGKKFTLQTIVGALPVHITATGLNCESCFAENKEVTVAGAKVAFSGGRLRFTGVTVDEPEGCTVTSEDGKVGQIVTKVLQAHWDFMDSGKAFMEFYPTAGATFAQFELGGAGCKAIAGKKNILGTLFGELKSGTGVYEEKHQVEVSPMIQETAGAKLTVGTNEAKLTGTAAFGLTKEEGKKLVPLFAIE